jgi:carboxyl-terminal processing protease
VPSVVAKRLAGDVAYVRIKQFQVGTYEELLRGVGAVRNAASAPLRGVLLDLRSNPGGLVDEAEAIADELLDVGAHLHDAAPRQGARSGERVLRRRARCCARGGARERVLGQLVELVAGALQDSRARTIVGQRTFGKGSVQTIFDLPNGAGLRLTTMRYYTPSGRSIQAQGIDPDVLVRSATTAADGIVREGDLEGHLAAETAPSSGRPQRIVIADPPPSGAAPLARSSEVPDDPSKGDDFVLKTAYEALRTAPRP